MHSYKETFDEIQEEHENITVDFLNRAKQRNINHEIAKKVIELRNSRHRVPNKDNFDYWHERYIKFNQSKERHLILKTYNK